MIFRARTWDPFEGADEANVFVPGIMGAGVLVSIGILVSDALRQLKGERGERRRVEMLAGAVTREFAQSVHLDDPGHVVARLRARKTYGLVAAALLALGIYGAAGSSWNFFNPVDEGWSEDIAWFWALSMVVSSSLVWIGATLARLFLKWPAVPAGARFLLVRTPLGGPARRSQTGA